MTHLSCLILIHYLVGDKHVDIDHLSEKPVVDAVDNYLTLLDRETHPIDSHRERCHHGYFRTLQEYHPVLVRPFFRLGILLTESTVWWSSLRDPLHPYAYGQGLC